jgi:hypothetical protein
VVEVATPRFCYGWTPPSRPGNVAGSASKEEGMYVRIARFDGIDTSKVDETVEAMKQAMDAMRRGEVPEGIPEASAAALRDDVVRVVDLVDRASGTGAGLVFTESEDGMRRVDEALNAMSPGEGGGRRTGVEIYEVTLDESFA